uniref:Uncharacterized protein n=1 Tax=Schlesneria paludicola TaxID=360056 RepID=A0A7C4LIY5_9PLAN
MVLTAALAGVTWGDNSYRRPYDPPALPPWMYARPFRTMSSGVWAPFEQDWRTVDWNRECLGCGMHRTTQAFSLEFERKYVAPAKPSRRPWDTLGILEYLPFEKQCGPTSR